MSYYSLDQFKKFPELFHKYRLLSGFDTLQEFSDCILKEGLQIDRSTISRWQNGHRLPDRPTAIILLKIFIEKEALVTNREANLFLESLGEGYLTKTEVQGLFFEDKVILQDNSLLDYERKLNVRQEAKYFTYLLAQAPRGSFCFYSQLETSQQKVIKILRLCLHYGFYYEALELWNYFSLFLWDTGQWYLRESLGKKMLGAALLLEDYARASRVAIDLAWIYYWQARLSESLNLLKRAQKWLQAASVSEQKKLLINLLNSRLGLIYIKNHQLDLSFQKLKPSLTFFKNIKNQSLAAKAALGLGHLYFAKNQLVKAQKYYEESLELAKFLKDENVSKAKFYLAEVKLQQNKKMAAKGLFLEALDHDLSLGRPAGIAWSKLSLAQMKAENVNNFAGDAAKIFESLGMHEKASEASRLLI